MDIEDELDLEHGHDLEQSDGEIEDLLENPDAEAVEETADGDAENTEGGENDTTQKKPVKKRVVLNPRPKLDSQRLGGPKGIPILPKLFENKKFKGKGFEKEDLNEVMSMLEHWGHRLFPIMTFGTLLETVEKLGTKKPTQVCIKKMRMDMPILDSDFVTQREEDEAESSGAVSAENHDRFEDMDMNDAFDNLVRNQDTMTQFNGTGGVETGSPSETEKPPERMTTITDEMRERIERNKQLALERKRQKQLEREKMSAAEKTNEQGESSNIVQSVVDDVIDLTEEMHTDCSARKSTDTTELTSGSFSDLKAADKELNKTCETTKFGVNNGKGNHFSELLDEDEMLEEMWGSA